MAPPRPSPIEGLFDKDHQERKVARILDRALAQRVKATQKTPRSVVRPPAGNSNWAQKETLGQSLAKAITSSLGTSTKGKASIRQKAADNNGVPFHFAHHAVTKGAAGSAVRNGKLTPAGKAGTAGAHARYIERGMAVEAVYAPKESDVELGAEAGLDAEAVLEAAPRKRGRPTREMVAERELARARRCRTRTGRGTGVEWPSLHREPGEAQERRGRRVVLRQHRRQLR